MQGLHNPYFELTTGGLAFGISRSGYRWSNLRSPHLQCIKLITTKGRTYRKVRLENYRYSIDISDKEEVQIL